MSLYLALVQKWHLGHRHIREAKFFLAFFNNKALTRKSVQFGMILYPMKAIHPLQSHHVPLA